MLGYRITIPLYHTILIPRKVKYSAKFFFGFHKVNLHHTNLGHTDQIYAPQLVACIMYVMLNIQTTVEKAHTSFLSIFGCAEL